MSSGRTAVTSPRRGKMASSWMHVPSATRFTEDLVIFLKEQRPEYLPDVLANYRQHGVFPTQGSSDVAGLVGFSNAKLSSSKTRFEGLCLLSMLVKDSSSDLFQQHCVSWLRSLQQIIQSQAPIQTIWLTVNILKDVLHYSCHLPEVAREVGMNSILGLLTSLLGLKRECELAAMEGMIACMVYYPRACASLKDKLAAYFLSKMDSTNGKAQEMACQCYSHLPCLGGMLGSVGVGRGEGWTYQIHCLLASANSLLAQLYQGAETDVAVHYQGPGVELAFPQLDQTDPHLYLQVQNRYTAVCRAIKHTLGVDPGSAVHLPVRLLLNMVCRALAVTSKNMNLSADGSLRVLVLPSIHTSTLEVLSDLITVVRSGMVQYAAVIQRLFSQTLSAWTPQPETSVGQQRAYSLVRVSVYRTLELWVQVGGASASILQGTPGHAELLFSHLLGDITPGADSIKLRAGLCVDVVPGGKPGPRRTKQLVMADAVGPSLLSKGELLSNQDTCVSALRALRQIIQTSGTLLKEDVHKRLHEVVLPLCVRLQQQQSSSSAYESAGGISGQFSSALTRRELYRLLLALVLNPSPYWPPPLTCAVSIFSNGRIDHSLKVSSFCAEAQTICNSMLHPRTPSIGLPLPPLTLKPTSIPSVLSSQGSAPRLTLPTLLGGPAPGPPFPTRHSLGLGPTSLLGSLENHLSLVPGLPGQAPTPGDLMLPPHSHHQQDPAGLGPPEGQRPVFVRYDKEEADDVEISLASDSDDSVVIVPPGMLDMENKQEDAANSQNMLSASTSGAGVVLPGGDSVTTDPTTAAAAATNVASFPDDLTTPTNPINAFPSSSASVVSLVPSLNSSTASDPLGGLGDSLSGKPQLQQMLMQPPNPDQTASLTLPPHQVHQLQNQLSQQGRSLQHPPAPASNEESTIININSTDEEEEDEDDMDDDEELEEEEEEEDGLDEDEEDEEEEEEGSDEFYVGEEYEDFEEEGEELEEEEEEDGDMPPLEGAEEKSGDVEIEEGNVIPAAAVDGEGMAGCSGDGDTEGGIEEVQTSRTLLKVQEVESIGVLEEEQEGEGEEDENESMDDPTMPQILCVTGGALEERVETSDEGAGPVRALQQDMSLWEQGAKEIEMEFAAEKHTASQSQQQVPVTEPAQDDGVRDQNPSSHQDQHAATADQEVSVEENTEESGQTSANERDANKAEQSKTEEGQGGENDGEERKGIKRKRGDGPRDQETEKSTEKKKPDDMVSMLADFVASPPDEEDVASGLDRSNICPQE